MPRSRRKAAQARRGAGVRTTKACHAWTAGGSAGRAAATSGKPASSAGSARAMRARAACHARQARRLGEEHRGLQRVEAAVAPELRVHVRADRAVRAQPPHARRHVVARRDHRAAVAPGAEVLRREEAEAARVARRPPRGRRVVARAERLRRVARRARAPRCAASALELRRPARSSPKRSHRHDRPHAQPRRVARVDRLADRARARVHRRPARRRRRPGRAPVAAMASAAATKDSAGVTTASPAPTPERAQRQLDGVRPRRHAHRVRRPALARRAIARTPRRASPGRTARLAPPRRSPPATSAATSASCAARSTSGTRITTCGAAATGSDVRTRSWYAKSSCAERDPLPLRALRDDLAPRIDDERLAVRLPAARVLAVLRRGEHVDLVLDGAGAEERVPVVLARRQREGRRHGDDARALVDELAIELGEAHVVADAQADAGRRAPRRSPPRAPAHRRGALAERRPVGQAHVEEVHLAVRRGDGALRDRRAPTCCRGATGRRSSRACPPPSDPDAVRRPRPRRARVRMGPGNAPSSRSASSRLWASSPMKAKFSGRATSSAPAAAACATQWRTRSRFSSTSSWVLSWMTATRMLREAET